MATLGQQLAAHPHRPPTARHTLEKGVVVFAECTCRSMRNLRARTSIPARVPRVLAVHCRERSQEAVKGLPTDKVTEPFSL